MNNTARFNQPAQPLLSGAIRFVIAAAVAALLAIAWIAAEHESRGAVIVAGAAMKSEPTRITLPAVEVVVRRGSGKLAA